MDVHLRFAVINVCRLFADARYFTGATIKGEDAIRSLRKQWGGKLIGEFEEIWLAAKNATDESTRERACRAARAWLIGNYELTPDEFTTDKERQDGTADSNQATLSPGRSTDEVASSGEPATAADGEHASLEATPIGDGSEDPAPSVDRVQEDSEPADSSLDG